MLRKSNQNGFSMIESLLIIIILVMVAFVGYYVYHTQKQTNTELSSVTQAAKNSSNGGKGGNAQAQTGSAKTEGFLIPEWNVQAVIPTPPEQAALIQYLITPAQPTFAKFTTQELIDLNRDTCSAENEPAGIITRGAADDPYYFEDGTPSGKTVVQEFTSSPIKPYKVVNGYYYWYIPAQAPCDITPKGKDLQSAAATQVKSIVNHLSEQE
jgi:type II secretory pathway pseudopilin PulG